MENLVVGGVGWEGTAKIGAVQPRRLTQGHGRKVEMFTKT